ncbi:hypothetical protein ABPG72_016238 [Tetrahymena utriculariae]
MKLIDSLKEIQTLLSNKENPEQQLNVSELKIEIKNENVKGVHFLSSLHKVFPNIKILILSLDKTQLQDEFLIKLNQFKIKQIQNFILFVRNKFYNNYPINYSYSNKNLVISCGFCQISFENEFNSSIWLKCLQENIYSMNIKQNQQHLLEILQKYIKNDISDIKVELLHQNNLYASLSNGNSQIIVLQLNFDEIGDLLQFKIHEYQIVEINIPFKDLQISRFNQCFLFKQIKKRHNFSFIIQQNVTIFSFKEVNAQISNSEQIYKCLKRYELNNSSAMNLNTKFKIQFYKRFVLENQVLNNSLNAYDINLYLHDNNQRIIITKIKYNLSENKERKVFEIDLENTQDVIDILQSYFFALQNVKECKNIKLKFVNLENENKEIKSNFFELITEINFMNANITKVSLDLSINQIIQEYKFISQIQSLQTISIKIINSYGFFDFLQKNSLIFRKLYKLINFDVQFTIQQNNYNLSRDYQLFQKDVKLEKIYKDYERLINLNIYYYYTFYNQKDFFTTFLKKFKRLTKISYFYNTKKYKNYKFDDYDDQYYKYYILKKKQFENALESKGKVHFAYLLIDNHDDIQCSYTLREFCTCQNNQMQKLLKKPSQFFINEIAFNENFKNWNDD